MLNIATDSAQVKRADIMRKNFLISCLSQFDVRAASAPPSPNIDIDTAPVNKAIITLNIFFIAPSIAEER
jgi:hypothetical protein